MYEEQFGLARRVFRGNAAGADVFVGPQTATIRTGIKKALAGLDAVVTVSGPVGSGKSTAVAHALAAIRGNNAVVRVGRFPLQRGEVLDLLFDHMRIQQRPSRANRKVALFRHLLFNLAKNDSRMFILVEDAPFLGEDILGELEVLTAADTGPSDGANIVVMGDESLQLMLTSKRLARLRQRIRLRRTLEPCGVEELAGYLRHCFRAAGAEFDQVFADGSFEVLHQLSGGILRVVNNLVESSMEAAADAQADLVDSDLIVRVANEEFGLTGTFTTPPQIVDHRPEPKHSDAATAELVALSMPGATAADAGAEPSPDLEALPQAAADESDDDIPDLIQDTQPALSTLSGAPQPDPEAAPEPELIHDTLPDLEVLSPELAQAGNEKPTPTPATAPPADSKIPTLSDAALSDTPEPAPAGVETADPQTDRPDWERDPTLAELQPDLEALERAMAVAQGRDADGADEPAEPAPEPEEDEQEATLAGVPEITLDDSINRKVDAAALETKKRQEDETGIVDEDAQPDADEEAAEAKRLQAEAELEKIAAGLAQAKTIEDVDDKMAETLFGEELSIAAAAVAKKVAQEQAGAEPSEPAPAEPAAQEEATPASNGGRNSLEQEFEKVRGETRGAEVSIESQIESQAGGLDMSASQRLATVRALDSGDQPASSRQATRDSAAPPVEPQPIEEQITTSMTQTLEALDVRPERSALNDGDDDDDDPKAGFFRRFRRS